MPVGPQRSTTESATGIAVTVRLFASVRESAGTAAVNVRLGHGALVEDALNSASKAVPGVWKLPSKYMIAVNGQYAGPTTPLSDGDTVAVIPPVSGGSSRQFIKITSEPLEADLLVKHILSDADGAVVTFIGVTRDHNEGRHVEFLEYEAYQPMAEEKIAGIIDDMKSRWQIGNVAVAHRTGRVNVGETSMVLAVSAPHRRPAFEAALYFVDQLKLIVPIWKKEHFEGGEVWIGETSGKGHPQAGKPRV